ncbi:hypothetical protein Pelo_13333 [Pelomyxa schiedti]|nr:hypothetical protein Pelo_13333 [Pelomyxa schiedti]
MSCSLCEKYGNLSLHVAAGLNEHLDCVAKLLAGGGNTAGNSVNSPAQQPLWVRDQDNQLVTLVCVLSDFIPLFSHLKVDLVLLQRVYSFGGRILICQLNLTYLSKKEVPLHCAVRFNNPIIAKFLLDSGSKIDSKRKDGKSPLDLAREYGKPELVHLLTSSGEQSVEQHTPPKENWTIPEYSFDMSTWILQLRESLKICLLAFSTKKSEQENKGPQTPDVVASIIKTIGSFSRDNIPSQQVEVWQGVVLEMTSAWDSARNIEKQCLEEEASATVKEKEALECSNIAERKVEDLRKQLEEAERQLTQARETLQSAGLIATTSHAKAVSAASIARSLEQGLESAKDNLHKPSIQMDSLNSRISKKSVQGMSVPDIGTLLMESGFGKSISECFARMQIDGDELELLLSTGNIEQTGWLNQSRPTLMPGISLPEGDPPLTELSLFLDAKKLLHMHKTVHQHGKLPKVFVLKEPPTPEHQETPETPEPNPAPTSTVTAIITTTATTVTSEEPPHSHLHSRNYCIDSWRPRQVEHWLVSQGIEEQTAHAATWRGMIPGWAFIHVTAADLLRFGVPRAQDRKVLREKIALLSDLFWNSGPQPTTPAISASTTTTITTTAESDPLVDSELERPKEEAQRQVESWELQRQKQPPPMSQVDLLISIVGSPIGPPPDLTMTLS